MLRKILLGGVTSSVMVLASGGAQAVMLYGGEMDEAREIQPSGTSFDGYLAREYRDFFLFEADEMYDWIDADYFAGKALEAQASEDVQPENPANWDIDDAHMPALVEGRRDLMAAFSQGGKEKAPEAAAVAQVKYDCWVEQQEEGHQPTHIAACREDFLAALAELESAMQVAEAPEPETRVIMGEELARTILYFDFDRADITQSAQTTIDSFVEDMKGRGLQNVAISLEGHADRAGPNEYNEGLSERRAEEVRQALLREGIEVLDLEEVKTAAQGETQPAVPTADGVPAQANRRVEVVARGMYMEEVPADQPTSGQPTGQSQ